MTQVREDLRASSSKIKLLDSALEPLKVSYDVVDVEKEELRVEIQ